MILTPFAAASTVTTFSDGSSEVVVEFKDGFNSVNSTDGGFYLGSDETITDAMVNISSEPMLHSTSMVMQVCNHSLGTATSTMVQLPSIMSAILLLTKTHYKIQYNLTRNLW